MRTWQRALPTIVITAHDERGTGATCLRAGAIAYLRKPLDGIVVMEAVAEALGGSKVIVPR